MDNITSRAPQRNSPYLLSPPRRDVVAVAAYRHRRGLEIGERLEAAAIDADSAVARAVAFRLKRCADERNLWTATDLHRESDGELYRGTGGLWSCGNRLCLTCCASMARASRRQGREAIDKLNLLFDKRTQFRQGLRWRSLVLTMPLMKGADVTDSIARINDAFRRLTNRQFWKSRVKGGIKSVEFTVRPNGFHAHIHLLLLSGFIPANAERAKKSRTPSGNLQDEMKHCLTAAGARVEGSPIVWVADTKRQGERTHGDEITLEKALAENCKYLTKTESWDSIPDSQLVKVAEVKRWARMFEVLGAARGVSDKEADKKRGEVEGAERTSVHTPSLFNGEKSATWRQELARMPFEEWKLWMKDRIRRAQEFRVKQLKTKFPYALFTPLSDSLKRHSPAAKPPAVRGFAATADAQALSASQVEWLM